MSDTAGASFCKATSKGGDTQHEASLVASSPSSALEGRMKVFVAGASGTIGLPLVRALCAAGHEVTGMIRGPTSAEQLRELGAIPSYADALEPNAVKAAIRNAEPDVVIDQLTCLPADPADLIKSMPVDTRLHREGGAHLLQAAREAGVRRYIMQSRAFYLEAADGSLADEDAKMRRDAPGEIDQSCQAFAAYEHAALSTTGIEVVVLRYGFFYGPGTWYDRNGAAAGYMRQRATPIVGEGSAVWSFVYLQDAIAATVAALDGLPGVYNVVDNDPVPVATWRPAFARWLAAPQPFRLTIEEGLQSQGETGVFYDMHLTGASNARAKAQLRFAPRRLLWLDA